MMNDPMSRYVLAKGLQREMLREAAMDGQAKAARRSRLGLAVLLLFCARRARRAVSRRLKKLAKHQVMR